MSTLSLVAFVLVIEAFLGAAIIWRIRQGSVMAIFALIFLLVACWTLVRFIRGDHAS